MNKDMILCMPVTSIALARSIMRFLGFGLAAEGEEDLVMTCPLKSIVSMSLSIGLCVITKQLLAWLSKQHNISNFVFIRDGVSER